MLRLNKAKNGGNMKRFSKYLIWSLIIIFILFLGSEIESRLEEYSAKYYKVLPYMAFTLLFPILVGMIFRLPQFVTDIILKKRWSVDWVKLSAIGIPSLYIAASPLLFFLNVPIINQHFASKMISSGFTMTTIAGVIFGYIILESLKGK